MGSRIIGLGFGIFGIAVLDLGFAGSSITDLLHIGTAVPTLPTPTIPGANLFATLAPGGNMVLFIFGGVFLAAGMVILIAHNAKLAKLSTVPVPSK